MLIHNPANSGPNLWRWRLSAAALAGFTAGLVGNGCILDFKQCEVDADCDKYEGDYVCENNLCVGDPTANESETNGDGDGDSGDGDGDGDGDAEGDGDGDMGDGDGDQECTHTQCIADNGGDENYLCNAAGECMLGINADCLKVVWPNNTPADNVVFVGSIMPTSPPYDTLVQPIENAMGLAIDEFNDASQLPGGTEIAWVACDSKGSANLAVSNAMHLAEIGVPAIVGPILSEDVLAVAEQVAIPEGIFMISPTGTNKNITSLIDDDLVWRTIASDVYQANALADRMNDVASLNSTVIVYKDDAYGTDLATDTYAALDGPLAQVTNTYPYTVVADMQQLQQNIGELLGNVISNDAPETVVIVGTSEAALIMLIYLQVASQINPALIPDKFIVSHGAVPAMLQTINNAPNDPTKQLLYSIMEGVAPVVFDPGNYGAFNIKYKVAFMDQDPITTSSLSYDALMVTAFAMAAIPQDDPITGAAIAEQMGKLIDPDGIDIDFGSMGFIQAAVNALSVGNTVDLFGISGPLEFDPETGDVRTNLEGWNAEPIGGNLSQPTIVQNRLYTLNPEPATDGVWSDLP